MSITTDEESEKVAEMMNSYKPPEKKYVFRFVFLIIWLYLILFRFMYLCLAV